MNKFIIIYTITIFTFFQKTLAQEVYIDKVTQDTFVTINLKVENGDGEVEITAKVTNGNLFFEGDILLGTFDDIVNTFNAAGIIGVGRTWSDGIVPYVIQENHVDRTTILEAIEHFNSNADIEITLVENSNLNRPNFIAFVDTEAGCFSSVGRIGGRQRINTTSLCGFGATVHEIMHAIGFFHEQSRQDRDAYVMINWDNIDLSERDKQINFGKYSLGQDIGSYDYSSIMHYSATAFNGGSGQKTIDIKIPPGTNQTVIGQRSGLSQGDIEGINRLYPYCDCSQVLNNFDVSSSHNFDFKCYQANNLLRSNAVIPVNKLVSFKAGNKIELLPGFTANGKIIAEVRSDFCEGNLLKSEGDIETKKRVLKNTYSSPLVTLKVSPNPIKNSAEIAYNLPEPENVEILLLDLYGRKIKTLLPKAAKDRGSHAIHFDTREIGVGNYLLLFRGNRFSKTEKIIVVGS